MSWSNKIEFQIKDVTSVEFNKNEFEIYPNPATDYITIPLESSNCRVNPTVEGIGSVEIYDVMGILIQTDTIHPMTKSHRMNIEHLAPGVYFVKISGSNGAYAIVEKFVKY